MELVFYTTAQCHLCELAEALLVNTPLEPPLPVEVIDIAEAPELVECYGTRIPVLRRTDTGEELDWPFNRGQLLDFLKANHECPVRRSDQ